MVTSSNPPQGLLEVIPSIIILESILLITPFIVVLAPLKDVLQGITSATRLHESVRKVLGHQ